MSLHAHVVQMAAYNEWMNAKIYETASRLSAEELAINRGAFFKSVLGTLNHVMVGDRIWLTRFACHPSNHAALEPLRHSTPPRTLDEMLCSDFDELREQRRALDTIIVNWTASLTDTDLNCILSYTNTKGIPCAKRFSSLVMHFFNHQTHHRGQVTTLLFQAGLDVGVTDLLALIPDEIDA